MLKQKSAIGNNIKNYRTNLVFFKMRFPKEKILLSHTIVKIEADSTPDPRIETVKKIADALGVSLDDLIHPVKYGKAVARLFHRVKRLGQEIIFLRMSGNLLELKKIARLSRKVLSTNACLPKPRRRQAKKDGAKLP